MCILVKAHTCACKSVFVSDVFEVTVNSKQQAIFLLLLSTLTFLNQLGEAHSFAVFNNGKKNEKILKVAIAHEPLSGERNSIAM